MVWVDLGRRAGPEYAASFLAALERLTEDDADDRLQVDRLAAAMASLIGLGVRLHREPGAGWVRDDLPGFRTRARSLLAAHRPILSGFLARMETSIWESDGWYDACVGRSAAQIIRDEIEGGDDRPLIDDGRIAEADDDLRECAPEREPLPPDVIPGLPPAHWWWWAPEATPGAV